MFYRFLPLLLILAAIFLSVGTRSAVMQNKPVEFRLETFDPTGAPVAQVEPMITMTPFDPNDLSSLGSRSAGQPGDGPEAVSNMRITQVYTHGGEAGASFLNDYIEIFNAGNTTININGWAVVVNTLEGSTQQAFAAKYTSDNQITPGMHLLIRYAGNGSNGQPLTGLLSTINDISLGSTSGQIFLLSPAQVANFTPSCPTSLGPTGTVTDFLGYGPTSCSETSPAPALTQSNKSLTRINGGCTDTDNNLSDFSIVDPNPRNIFSAATPCGSQPTPTPTPTPGASPTPTPSPSSNGTMRISQIYTHGGEAGASFLNDYVEIFNAGNTTININGWAVVVNTFEGSTQQAFAVKYTSDNQITPGMHLLIRYAGNGSNGQPLTGLLSTINDISLGSTSGQIFLLSPAQVANFTPTCPTSLGLNGTVTDFLGYGPTNCSETSPAPALTQSNKSLTRINGGCTDTDNNLSDFSIVDPNPRNIFSAATPCGSQPTPTPTPTPTGTPTPTPTPTGTPTPTPSPGVSPTPPATGSQFNFSASQYEVFEGPTGVVITVRRIGDISTTVTVNFATSNGTAVAPGDYTSTSGTLTFAAGHAEGSFKIPVTDDAIIESDETFTVALSNPTGNASLGSISTATVTIHDNDAPLPTNPRIRISQIYARGGEAGATYQRDFLELFNADTTTVDLQGWSLIITTFDSSGNPSSLGGTISSSIPLKPGQHVILSMPGSGSNGQPLTAEFTLESISLGANGAQIFLIPKGKLPTIFTCPSGAPDPRGVVADFVAYGVATCFAGGVAPIPPPNKSLTRAGGGCTDTFHNANDFALTDPNPHRFADPLTPPCTAANNSTIQFSASQFSATESDGAAHITVTRTGDLSSVASVDYETSDGTATERTDYNRTAGTLNFGAGESQKTFDVLITDDLTAEPTETVNLALTRPGGNGTIGANANATLQILDNDTFTSTLNPIDAPPFYVDQHYHDFLNRVSDSSGLQFWINNIVSCGTDSNCVAVKRIDTSAAFFLSIEFQNTGFEVYRAYKAAFPDSAERPRGMVRFREFMRDTQAISHGVVVGNAGYQALLEANKVAFFIKFVSNPEFLALYPAAMSPGDFVDALNNNSGGVLSGSQRIDLINGLLQLKETRATVVRKIAENQNFSNAEFNKAFVLMQYFGYLRRNVDDPPDADFSGFDFWLNKMNQFNGDYRAAEMVKAFLSSNEYRNRFLVPPIPF